MSDFNDKIIKEFYDGDGVVGEMFDGANVLLLHHVGRKSGDRYIAPLRWFEGEPGTAYVVASAGGAPKHPAWYGNLVAAGRASVESGRADGVGGIDVHDVRVRELDGEERERVFGRIKQEAPGFADYETKTEGIRTMPVLELVRS